MDRHDWQRSLTYYGDKTMRRYDMKNSLFKFLAICFLTYMGFGAKAQEGMVYMDIGRAEARLPTYVMPNPHEAQGCGVGLKQDQAVKASPITLRA
ncbi:MAG: hypothetical protein EBZ84_13040 [Betaproteobacteria bacterium]|nr:hypothetical protein [Betaproteobacteria bacterium]